MTTTTTTQIIQRQQQVAVFTQYTTTINGICGRRGCNNPVQHFHFEII